MLYDMAHHNHVKELSGSEAFWVLAMNLQTKASAHVRHQRPRDIQTDDVVTGLSGFQEELPAATANIQEPSTFLVATEDPEPATCLVAMEPIGKRISLS